VNDFFLNHVVGAAGPAGAGQGKDVSLRQALDAAVPKIGTAFAGQPVTEAGVRDALGRSYLNLGLYEQALPQLRRAVELRREHLGEEDRDTLTSQMYLARVLYYRGDYGEAYDLYRRTYETFEARFGPRDEDTLKARGEYANILRMLRKM